MGREHAHPEHREEGVVYSGLQSPFSTNNVNQHPLLEGLGTLGVSLGLGAWFPGQQGAWSGQWALRSPHSSWWQNSPAPQELLVPFATTHTTVTKAPEKLYKEERKKKKKVSK